MKKKSIKEKVLEFVESKGAARYTEIQEFIVDHNKGEGTYKNGYILGYVWLQPCKKRPKGRLSLGFPNVYRGYYSSAFSGANPYFLYGNDYLEKREDGLYVVVRDQPKGKPYYRSQYWTAMERLRNRY